MSSSAFFQLRTAMLLAGAVVFIGSTAHAAAPEQACQATKNKAAGKYAACRHNAEAKLATSGDATRYGSAITKCQTKFTNAWNKATGKAIAAGATCLDDPLTVTQFQSVIAAHTTNVATALGGGGLADCPADLATCEDDLGSCPGDLATCTSDLAICNNDLAQAENNLMICQGDLATCQAAPQTARLKTGQTTCYNALGAVIACAGTGQDGELQKGLASAYTDNGDGTITDTKTGLMWEKLSDDGSIHDKDNVYTWVNAFAVKVSGLNAAGGFAGHTDWRVPNVNELQSLVNYGSLNPSINLPAFNTACAASCTVTMCSCTQPNFYWSGTTNLDDPSDAWGVYFLGGYVVANSKDNSLYIRGVRGGA